MEVESLCNREVDTVEPTESALAAARRMQVRNVGSLVVVREDRCPIGIITDRDLTVRVLAQNLSPETPISEVMSADLRIVAESHTLDAALSKMREVPCRRLPVVDADETLVGILTLDDIQQYHAEEAAMMDSVIRREGPNAIAPPPGGRKRS